MDAITIGAIVVLLIATLLLRIYIQRQLTIRGVRTVIGRLRQHGALSPESAQPAEAMCLRTTKPFGRKSYQVMALHYLMQEDIVRTTADGQRLYLSERVHEVDPSFVPD